MKKSEFACCMVADQEACHGWTDTYWLWRAGKQRMVVVIRWGKRMEIAGECCSILLQIIAKVCHSDTGTVCVCACVCVSYF